MVRKCHFELCFPKMLATMLNLVSSVFQGFASAKKVPSVYCVTHEGLEFWSLVPFSVLSNGCRMQDSWNKTNSLAFVKWSYQAESLCMTSEHLRMMLEFSPQEGILWRESSFLCYWTWSCSLAAGDAVVLCVQSSSVNNVTMEKQNARLLVPQDSPVL